MQFILMKFWMQCFSTLRVFKFKVNASTTSLERHFYLIFISFALAKFIRSKFIFSHISMNYKCMLACYSRCSIDSKLSAAAISI